MNSKKVEVIGGIGNLWGNQFHQQDRIYNTKCLSPTINAMANIGLFIKRANLPVHKITIKRTVVIGQMDNSKDHTFESANRIYSKKACCPTINTCGGGGLQAKVIKRWKK